VSTLFTRPVDSSVLGPEISLLPDDHPFRRDLRGWLEEHCDGKPEPLNQDEKFEFRRAWQRELFAAGWAGPAWPEQHGGRGAGPLEQIMYYEELALARAPRPVNEPGIILLGPTLMIHGTQELQERYLQGILSGEEIWCQGFSEPDAGSDLAAVRTRARLEDGQWVVDGQKIWTTWAQYSDWCFVLCRTDPQSRRHRGLTLIIVPMEQEGITSNPILQMSGDPEFGEVFLDGARTDEALVVGEVGDGWQTAMTMFQFERADMGFTDHARLLVTLYDAAEVLRRVERERLASPPVCSQARLRLADLWIRCQQLRRMNVRAAVRAAEGEPVGVTGSAVNLHWASLEQDVAKLVAGLHRAEGVELGHHVSHHLLASRAASIYSGTSEIQRNIVAERMLRLPR
jgi:alkylation response protein AidB-like acyl-CoA dehydrogenase